MTNSTHKKHRPVKYSLFKNQIDKQDNQSFSHEENVPYFLKHNHNYSVHTPAFKLQTSISRPNSKTKMEYLRELFSLPNSNTQTPSSLESIQKSYNPFEKIDLIKNSEKAIKTKNDPFFGSVSRSAVIQLDIINRYRQSNILNNKSSINASTKSTIINKQDIKRQKNLKKKKIQKKTNIISQTVNQSKQTLQKFVQLQTMIKSLEFSIQKNRRIINDGFNFIKRIYSKSQNKQEQKHIENRKKKRIHNNSTILKQDLQYIQEPKINCSLRQRNENKQQGAKCISPKVKYSKKHYLFQKKSRF